MGMFDLEPSQIPLLRTAFTDAFQELFYRLKKDQIYAFVLVLNEFYAVDHVTVSTENSIFNDQEDQKQYLREEDKWNVKKWKYQIDHTHQRLSALNNSMHEYFNESILSKVYINTQNSSEHNSLNIYIEGMRQAKEYLTQIYRLKADQILFFIDLPNKPDIAMKSAQQLNEPSSLLYEFIANVKTDNIKSKASVNKLSQIDKDILVDLAQIVENSEPYDALFVAHQAYILSLEPYFLESSQHVQNLINHIAAIDENIFALEKDEILDRIKQFYKV